MPTLESLWEIQIPAVRDFLAALPEKVLRDATVETIPAGTIVAVKNESVRTIDFILLGEMCVVSENDEGKPYYWLDLKPFTAVGDLELLAEADVYADNVGARVQTTLLRVGVDVVRESMLEDSALYRHIVLNFAKNTYRNTYRREYTVYRSGYEKVAIYLAGYCAERYVAGRSIEVKMTRIDLAEYLGLSAKTVSRSIEQLKAEGLLTVEKRRIMVTPYQCEQLRKRWSTPVKLES